MRLGMAMLAVLTLIFGFFAGNISKILSNVISELYNIQPLGSASVFNSTLPSVHAGNAVVSMPAILFGLILALAIVGVLVALVARKQKVTQNITWDCGTNLTPRMEITATGFSRSIITIFKGILKPTKQTDVEYRDAELRYFPKVGVVTMELQDVYSKYFYEPLRAGVLKIAGYVKKIQSGNVNAYVLYIFLTLIVLLVALTF